MFEAAPVIWGVPCDFGGQMGRCDMLLGLRLQQGLPGHQECLVPCNSIPVLWPKVSPFSP